MRFLSPSRKTFLTHPHQRLRPIASQLSSSAAAPAGERSEGGHRRVEGQTSGVLEADEGVGDTIDGTDVAPEEVVRRAGVDERKVLREVEEYAGEEKAECEVEDNHCEGVYGQYHT